MKSLWKWFSVLCSGEPHHKIGAEGNWYMLRWFLIPSNRWINLYLHKFLRDDDDRALHDHPWWFVSFIIKGGYWEITPNRKFAGKVSYALRYCFSIAYRKAEHRHRVELLLDEFHKPQPCWTIVLTGPRVREWGFWCPQGFVHWKAFTDPTNSGLIGKGCDQ